jgi:hypothetical protein
MNAVNTTTIETAAGPREMRWTPAGIRRIKKRFGSLAGIDEDDDPANLAEACWLLMFDDHGKPPEGLDLEYWMNTCPMDPEAQKSLGASLGSIISGKEKNEVRVLVERETERQTGSDSTPSPMSASDSPEENSGTDTQSENSTPSPTSGERSATSPTTALVSSQPQL